MKLRRLLLPTLLLGFGPAGACSCDEDTIIAEPIGTCEPDATCPQGYTYRLGECRVARCADDNDCCPGQRCSVAAGLCVDQLIACSDDAECGEVPGRACIEFRGGQFCGFPNADRKVNEAGTQACSTDADCAAGANCVGQRCLVAAPCEGGCEGGEVCDVDTNTCFALDTCEVQCAEGQMRVVADPDTMSGEQCCLVECACATLPAVAEGQFGWHASIAADAQSVFVSAYDAQYGDLVVAEFDPSGAPIGLDYVDGFPTDGPLVGNPNGRRNGRILPGPDVGEYTSIVRSNGGDLHVAYYDRDGGQLKYARRSNGLWSTHVVDDSGDVGRFTSIALDLAGKPRIAYMAVEVPGPMGPQSGLRYAAASSPTPGAASDWAVTDVERVNVPPPVCGGGCDRNQACVDLGGGPVCTAESTTCPVECDTDEACVANAGGSQCAVEIPTVALDDLPPGTGLFASLLIQSDGQVRIAFYDRLLGRLRLATGRDGNFTVETLDGGDPETDVGAHVSLARAADGRLGLAYMDFGTDDLVYLEPGIGLREIIDDGVSPPDLRMVGADASLVFDPSDAPAVAYQDGSNLDLMYARRVGDTWRTEILRGGAAPGQTMGAAAGFYASQARVDGAAFVCSVAVGFDEASNLQLELSVDRTTLD